MQVSVTSRLVFYFAWFLNFIFLYIEYAGTA
jgi:hypothetical protein